LNRMGARPADTLAQVEELDTQARRCAGEMAAAHAA
jgi:hypothetical protein